MRFIPLFILSLLALSSVKAQNCGCADEGNCPFPFAANTSTQVCYEITDAFNNNLASPTQGVCGVSITLRHGRIGGLDLTLTSPSGQQVQLIGTAGNCNTWTPIATWDVLFLPCSETCEPDTVNGCAYPCVFDGCPANCAWSNATFTGSYQPFVGCLEDFNTGPANGQWCLEINNGAQFNGGQILDFEIILCDQSGILCCDADAGNLAFEPDVTACQGDTTLLLDLDPQYGPVVPDPLEYGYTYAIFSQNMLVAYDDPADLTAYMPGTYQVCGLSFLYADTAAMPDPGEAWTPLTLNDTLTSALPPFCGDIATNCILVTIGGSPSPTQLLDTICVGGAVMVGTTTYTAPGNYTDTLITLGGCDSIVNLTLTVLPTDMTVFSDTLCNGDSLLVGNEFFKTTGTHTVVLQNQNGCDSTVTVNLTALQPISTMLIDTVCIGDTVWVGATPYNLTGIYTETLTSFMGCDSIVTLDLTVVFVGVSIGNPDTLGCQQSSVTLNATASTSLGQINYQWTTIGGHFIGTLTGPTTQVDQAGTYIITIQSTGCMNADTVEVLADTDVTIAVATASDDTLTCYIPTIILDATASTGGPNLQFLWSAEQGSPISDPASQTPTVTQPDTYHLTVTDLDNGCQDTTSVTVFQNILAPMADAGQGGMISCTVPTIPLDGSASMPAGGIDFAWETMDGGFASPTDIAMPSVNAGGTYTLVVTDIFNGCKDTASVLVTLDTLVPNAVISFPVGNTVTCAESLVTLDGSASTGSQFVVYQWVGNILSGQGTLVATTETEGIYTLIITDTLNGCSNTATVDVYENTAPPSVEAGDPDTLSCTNISAELGSINTSDGNGFMHVWTSSPGGSFVTPPSTPFVTVDSAATYYLTVTDLLTECVGVDSVVISENYDPPVVDAGPDGVLNCQDSTFVLDGTASVFLTPASQIWKNSSGTTIASGTLQTTVNATGIYTLSIKYAFCEVTDTVEVMPDFDPPLADAGSDLTLDCDTGETTLDGSGSDNGADFSYLWTTPNGLIISDETTLSPLVGKVGMYILEVTSSLNHCTAQDTVLVTIDTAACLPLVNAGADGLYNCYDDDFQDTLAASGSMGANFSYLWTALSGNIIQQADPFAPIVTSGVFVFGVTNEAVGLTAFDTVVVVADTLFPTAELGGQILSLNCPELAACYSLDISGTSQGPEFSYFWESIDGEFCTPLDELQVEVLGTGVYGLTVTNTLNGCVATDAIFVQLLDFEPVADAGGDIQLACGDTIATLDGSNSSIDGTDYTYQWSSPGGNLESGGTTLAPEVSLNNGQDTFSLVVLNTINLCQDTDMVVVFAPTGCFPTCGISAPEVLDCDTDTIYLDAEGSSQGADISYQWLGVTATTCGGETTPTVCVNSAGVVQLTVTRSYPNGSNFSTDCSVQVFDSSQLPAAEAGPNANLNCANQTLTLNGNGSANGLNISYLWTTDTGHIVSGEATKTPVVDAPGMYEILVTNTVTGCSATDFVTIGLDTLHPTANAGPDNQLTCSNNSLALSGSGSPASVTYLWTTSDGVICAGPNTPTPVVCAPGTYILTVTNPVNFCKDSDTTVVTNGSGIPMADAGPDVFFTCEDTVFTLAASASGSGVLAYEWTATNGGCFVSDTDILQPTVGCIGTYRLKVTDLLNGCTALSEVEVVADNLQPVANAGGTQEINCSDFVLTLDGSASTPAGQLDFIWETSGSGHIVTGQTTAMPEVDSAGIYQLIVTDQLNGCKDTAAVTITIDADIPTADAGPDSTLTCTRLSLKLKGTGSSVGPTISYLWSTTDGQIVSGGTTLTPTIDQPGTYVLRVTDSGNNCIVTDTAIVTMDILPPNAMIDASQILTLSCADPQVPINGSLSTPTDSLTYHWTTLNGHILNGQNAPIATVDSTGIYTLMVTNTRNGCTATASISVGEDFEKPAIHFAPAPVLDCNDTTVQLQLFPPTADPIYTYAWSGPPTILDGNTATPTVNKSGVFHVTMTDTTNGCESDSSILVSENFAEPDAVATSLGKLDCENLSVQVSGQGSSVGNVSYLWTTTSAGNIATPTLLTTATDAQGWYFLTVTDLGNGCSSMDSTEVLASSVPIENALLTLDHPDCVDLDGYIYIDSVVGGAPPFFYSLDGDAFITYPQFSFLEAGEHELTIEDENGCSWTTTVVLLNPEGVVLDLGEDKQIRQGQSVELEGQTNLSLSEIAEAIWQNLPDSVACPTCLEQLVSPLKTTTYHLKIVDSLGCFATDRVTVVVNEERPFYVPTAFSPDGNNVNDLLILYAEAGVLKVDNFQIFDRWGNLVFAKKDFQPNDPANGWDGSFNGQKLDPAVFVWKAEVVFLNGDKGEFYGEVVLMR